MNRRNMDLSTLGVNEEKQTQPVPSSEVLERAKRWSFTAEYKVDILRRADRCNEPGSLGELLRSEGLYSSYLTDWRREREQSARAAMSKKRGRKPRRDP